MIRTTKLGEFRQLGEDACKRCFTRRAPQPPSIIEAIKQGQGLPAGAMEGNRVIGERAGWVERSETHRNVSAVSVGYGFA